MSTEDLCIPINTHVQRSAVQIIKCPLFYGHSQGTPTSIVPPRSFVSDQKRFFSLFPHGEMQHFHLFLLLCRLSAAQAEPQLF